MRNCFSKHNFALWGFLALFLCIGAIFLRTFGVGWWRIVLNGEMYGTMVVESGSIYIGDNGGTLKAVNKLTGKLRWSNRYDQEIFEVKTLGSRVIVRSGDSIVVLSKTSGKELWRKSIDSSFTISDFLTVNSKVIVFDRVGGVFAYSIRTGDLIWSSPTSFQGENVSEIYTSFSGPQWESQKVIVGSAIVHAPPGGNLISLDISTGKLNWQLQSDDLITSLSKSDRGKILYIGRKSGILDAVRISDGHLMETNNYDSAIHCVASLGDVKVVVLENGQMHGSGPHKDWSLAVEKVNGCPLHWQNRIFLKTYNGDVWSVDALSGQQLWKKKLSDKSIGHMSLHLSDFKSVILSHFAQNLFFGDPDILTSSDEGAWLLHSNDGSLKWQNDNLRNVYATYFSVSDFSYYVALSQGYLDRVNSFTGRYFVREKNDFRLTAQTYWFGKVPLFEITIHHDDDRYLNPFLDVQISGTFVLNEKKVTLKAFYYAKDTWKLRFVPDDVGEWLYELDFVSKFDSLPKIGSGAYNAKSSSDGAYLTVNKEFPQWLTLDGKHIWNGVGIQDYPSDRNWNSSYLDDFSLGVDTSNEFKATTSAGLKFELGNDLYVPLSRYLDISKNDGSITIYRWNLDFPKYSLMGSDLTNLRIDLQRAREMDTLFSELKLRDMAVWVTLFNFRLPFAEPAEEALRGERYIQPLIEYVVSRFGPYVDVWELSNEAHAPDAYTQKIVSLFRKSDYQSKLLTTSWEKPEVDGFDIVAPHWYESEYIPQSDLVTVNKITPLLKYNQPIVFGEQGNLTVNYDVLSSDRMRIRLWTAFFNKALFIFWNSSADIYKPPSDKFSNINIGDIERKYISVFRKLTGNIDLSANSVKLPMTGCGEIRSYALTTDKEQLIYLVKPLPKYSYASCELQLAQNGPVEVTFFDTRSGEVLDQFLFPTTHSIKIPDFYPDLFVKVDLLKSTAEK